MNDLDAAGVRASLQQQPELYSRRRSRGAAPIVIPHLEDEEALRRIYEMLDGILLTGGVDIHSKFYNQEPHPALDPPDVGMDRTETTLLPWALEDELLSSASAGASRCSTWSWAYAHPGHLHPVPHRYRPQRVVQETDTRLPGPRHRDRGE